MKKALFLLFLLQMAGIGLSAQVLRVMSMNVRYDNPQDSAQSWSHRKDNVIKAIKFYNADLLGTQEVLKNQFEDLRDALPEYDSYGVGRDDGFSRGEHMVLFWKKDLFKVRNKGTFWLSETPDMPSIGWDAACRRTATWLILYDKKEKKEILVVNTHLDHMGQKARQLGTNLLLNKIDSLAGKRPIVLTGDFNSIPEDSVIANVLDKKHVPSMLNSREHADIVYGPYWTFHDFGRLPLKDKCLIDYIFYSGFSSVERYASLCECIDGIYLSDHCPVVSDLRF